MLVVHLADFKGPGHSTLAVALGGTLALVVLFGTLGTLLVVFGVLYREYKIRLCENMNLKVTIVSQVMYI